MVLVLLTAMAAATPSESEASDVKKAQKSLNDTLKGKGFEARIKLGMGQFAVQSDGSFDKTEYARWLAGGSRFPAGERGKRLGVSVKEKKGYVVIVLCGRALGIMCMKTSGFRIDYGRRVTAADLTVDAFVRATSNLIKVDGLKKRSEFDAEGTFSNVTSSDTPAPPPEPVTVPASGANIQLIGVEVGPTEVHAGSSIRLIVHFEIGGLGPGQIVEIQEERQILRDGVALLPEPMLQSDTWSNGRHSTTVEFIIPDGADPGAYTLSVVVGGGAEHQQKSALFLVR